MAKKYKSPVLMDLVDPGQQSEEFAIDAIRDMKDDISTSFVYGDDSYEEEYVVPDIVEVIGSAEGAGGAETTVPASGFAE